MRWAEESEEAMRLRCLRLSRLSESGMELRPTKLEPWEIDNLGIEVSSSKLLFRGTKNPI